MDDVTITKAEYERLLGIEEAARSLSPDWPRDHERSGYPELWAALDLKEEPLP